MGREEFTQRVEGISEIKEKMIKMYAESKRNFKIAITTAIIVELTLIASVLALLK